MNRVPVDFFGTVASRPSAPLEPDRLPPGWRAPSPCLGIPAAGSVRSSCADGKAGSPACGSVVISGRRVEYAIRIEPGRAIGAPGYNMVQTLHWMRELAPRTSGKPLVWLIYPPNDLEDNIRPSMLQYRTPFVRKRDDGTWEAVTSHLTDEPWPFPSRKRHFENFVDICSDTDLGRRVFSACRHLLSEAAALAASMDSPLVVATVPELSLLADRQLKRARAESLSGDSYDPTVPDRRIGEICSDLGVSFVALSDELGEADYLENDVHWNAAGHRKVHEVLRRIWRDRPPPPAAVAGEVRTPATAAKG